MSSESPAMQRVRECLSMETSDEHCSLEVMESVYKEITSDPSKMTSAQKSEISDLWRLMKMIYNGATRMEALAALAPLKPEWQPLQPIIPNEEAAAAYTKALGCLNPASPEAAKISLGELESAYRSLESADSRSLDSTEVRTAFSQAQNQVVDQLRKVIETAKNAETVHAAIKKVWEDRDNAAHSRLLQASSNFIGMYPAGAADAFSQALDFLSPQTPEDRCTLQAMEAVFTTLDSELIRLECSEVQENVIDDLWRLIKMIYNGSTRKEALEARLAGQIQDTSAAEAYGKSLLYLNPGSVEFTKCSLEDLEQSYQILQSYGKQQNFSHAQSQVITQLQKAVQGAKGGETVQAAIREAWAERENIARNKIER